MSQTWDMPGALCLTMKYLDDLLVVVGCGLIVYGIAQISPVAAWITSGVFCMAGGVVLGISQRGAK
jgi:hypothetical protein